METQTYLEEFYFDNISYEQRELSNEKEFIDMMFNGKTDNVYVLYNPITKLFKIGVSTNMKQRISNIQTSSGCNVYTVMVLELDPYYDENVYTVESLLHKFFNKKRIKGEWFNLNIKDIIQIRNLFYSIEGEWFTDNVKEVFLKTNNN